MTEFCLAVKQISFWYAVEKIINCAVKCCAVVWKWCVQVWIISILRVNFPSFSSYSLDKSLCLPGTCWAGQGLQRESCRRGREMQKLSWTVCNESCMPYIKQWESIKMICKNLCENVTDYYNDFHKCQKKCCGVESVTSVPIKCASKLKDNTCPHIKWTLIKWIAWWGDRARHCVIGHHCHKMV